MTPIKSFKVTPGMRMRAYINNKTGGRIFGGSAKNLVLAKRLKSIYPKGSPKSSIFPNNQNTQGDKPTGSTIAPYYNSLTSSSTNAESKSPYNNPDYAGLPPGYMDPREIRPGKLETTFGPKASNKPVTVITESNA